MEYIKIGKIRTTHGIKGELKVFPLVEDLDIFQNIKDFYLGKNKDRVEIKSAREHKDVLIIKFNEFDNINDVISYAGDYLYMNIEDKSELSEDEYFIEDLIGLRVINLDMETIGEISEILKGPANDVYVIKDGSKEYMVPGVSQFVKEINLSEKYIKIDPIDGMIEWK